MAAGRTDRFPQYFVSPKGCIEPNIAEVMGMRLSPIQNVMR